MGVDYPGNLASDPEALLLDEPFSALDTYLRSQLEQQMVARLTDYDGVTLFITNNLEETYRICPNLMVMNDGNAIAQGTKQSIARYKAIYFRASCHLYNGSAHWM